MENFVTFEIAKKLKDKGFKEECLCHYIGKDLFYNIESPIANKQLWFSHNKFDNIWHRDNYDAPTISQTLKWLREEKKIVISILPTSFNKTTSLSNYYYVVYNIKEYFWDKYEYSQSFETYEECELSAIEYVLDNNLI